MAEADNTPIAARELSLTRLIAAPREHLYRCWTEPSLLKQWFAPKPNTTTIAELDVRPGGSNRLVMCAPDGKELYAGRGVYLDVVPNERIVFTDAFVKAWEPSTKPFMTAIITFAAEGGKTRYTARVLHWSAADRAAHEEMGFHRGWAICADQLAALAATL